MTFKDKIELHIQRNEQQQKKSASTKIACSLVFKVLDIFIETAFKFSCIKNTFSFFCITQMIIHYYNILLMMEDMSSVYPYPFVNNSYEVLHFIIFIIFKIYLHKLKLCKSPEEQPCLTESLQLQMTLCIPLNYIEQHLFLLSTLLENLFYRLGQTKHVRMVSGGVLWAKVDKQ